jgi:hypothetical protein
MTDAPGGENHSPLFRNSDTAPFIYFDNIAAHGTMAGARIGGSHSPAIFGRGRFD